MWTFFEIVGIVALVVAVVVAVLLLINRRAVQRFFAAGSAQFGQAGRWAANKDPIAMYKEKIDDATDHIRTAKVGLVRVRGLITGVQRQVDDGEREAARLDARVKTALSSGDENRAAEYVRQLQETKKQLEENRRQLGTHEETYSGFLKQVQLSQNKVMQCKQEAEKLRRRSANQQGGGRVSGHCGEFPGQYLGAGRPRRGEGGDPSPNRRQPRPWPGGPRPLHRRGPGDGRGRKDQE